MEVKIGKVLLSQIENPLESSNNKITLDGLVKFLKEMCEQYNVVEDKVLRFETCCLITMFVALLNMNVLGLGIAASSVSACKIAVIAGILKEAYDYKTYGLFETRIL